MPLPHLLSLQSSFSGLSVSLSLLSLFPSFSRFFEIDVVSLDDSFAGDGLSGFPTCCDVRELLRTEVRSLSHMVFVVSFFEASAEVFVPMVVQFLNDILKIQNAAINLT